MIKTVILKLGKILKNQINDINDFQSIYETLKIKLILSSMIHK